MSSILTYDEAIVELAKLTSSGNYSVHDLMALGSRVSVATASGMTQGSVTLLYSGPVNGVGSGTLVDAMMKQDANALRVIDKTQAGVFLKSDDFDRAFKNLTVAMTPDQAKAAEKLLYDATRGPWAAASRRFAAETVGEVRFLGPFADMNRQFGAAELPALLGPNSRVTRIEGIPIDDLREMGHSKAFKEITSRSALSAGYGGFKVVAEDVIGADGKVRRTLKSLDVGDFLKPEVLDTEAYAKAHPEAMQRFKEFIHGGTIDVEAKQLRGLARSSGNKLGTAGALLVFGIAFSDAALASERGDTEGARKIMEQWALEAAGSGAGAVIGGTVVSIAAAAAAAVGVTVGAPVVLALVIAGGIVGGIFGSEAATKAWEKFRGNADDSEMNMLEKFAAKVALRDYNVEFGTANADVLTGTASADYLFGGAGDDTLDGGRGNDVLRGGKGNDTYSFGGSWGKDVVTDVDGQGNIQIDGQTVGSAKAAGRNWTAKLDNGQVVDIAVYDDAQSKTGKRAVITRTGSTDNTITINDFDLTRAYAGGYLGIQLENNAKLALQDGNAFFWGDPSADPATLEGKGSNLNEGGSGSFGVSLNRPAEAGETLTLNLQGLDGKGVKVLVNGETVDANGAVIALRPGQTTVVFTLVQNGPLDADVTGSLSATYNGNNGSGSTNTWSLTLKDMGEPEKTLTGDIFALQVEHTGAALTRVRADGSTMIVVDTGEQKFVKDSLGNLVEGGDRFLADNTLYGSAGNDKIDGKTGNDLLGGNAGNDKIEGGTGDDMIGGGLGNDDIQGGDGNDYISSSADIQAGRQQLGVNDSWAQWGAPTGAQITASGAMWGVYPENAEPKATNIWHGITDTRTEEQSDVIDAGAGDDWVMASWGADRVQGGEGNDRLEGLAGDDIVEGGAGDDKIEGDGILKTGFLNSVDGQYHGNDFVDGGAGKDEIIGGGGNDDLFGGADDDKIYADTIGDSDSEDFLKLLHHGTDYIDGEGGNDYAEGGGNDDVLYGGEGNDTLWGDQTVDNLKGDAAEDPQAWGADYMDGEDGDDILLGGGKDDTLFGGAGNDQLVGDESNSDLKADANGADYLDGEDGNDTLLGGGKDDVLYGGDGDDQLSGDDSEDKLEGTAHGADYLDGEAGKDGLVGGGGADTLFGGADDDTLIGDANENEVAGEFHGADYLDGEEGNDQLAGGGGDDVLIGGQGDDLLTGDNSTEYLAAEHHGNDQLDGGAGNDQLAGTGGDDILAGGSGNDLLLGDDIEERLAAQYHGADILDGGEGDDQMVGGGGADYLTGGVGNDTLIGDYAQDQLAAAAHGADVLDGGDGDDILVGNGGQDVLLGGSGNDQLVGDAAESELDVAHHAADQLDGGEGNDTLFGGGGDDVLLGGEGHDYLSSGNGNDLLDGGAGDDLYAVLGSLGRKTIVDDGGTDVLELGWNLSDMALSPGSLVITNKVTGQEVHIEGFDAYDAQTSSPIEFFDVFDEQGRRVLMSAQDLLERLRVDIHGTDGDDVLQGTPFADRMLGGAGADTLIGLEGDDHYMLGADSSDTIVEEAGQGTDTVFTELGYSLEATPHVENVQLTGSADVNATGNDAANRLMGNSGANVLNGLGGADTLVGMGGDDVYMVDDSDQVIETAGGGTDTVYSSAEWTYLADHIEQLYLQGSAYMGMGNDADNLIVGTESRNELTGERGNDTILAGGGDDFLAGGVGADVLHGGEGHDWYVGNDLDTIVETGDGGDTLVTDRSADLSQGSFQLLENVMLEDRNGAYRHLFDAAEWNAWNATGNDVGNRLSGNRENNVLLGLGGDDRLNGNGGNDTLDGGEGADTMRGGMGDDTYHVDSAQDVVEDSSEFENNGGHDRVFASASVVLGRGIEEAILLGDADLRATGNEGVNRLEGNTGANILDGRGGIDMLLGGAGDDTYFVHTQWDQAIEAEGEGTDTVYAKTDYTLGANVENLTLLSNPSGWISFGRGNSLDNVLVGNDMGAALFGMEGNDRLVSGFSTPMFGGDGNDTLLGAMGGEWLDGGAGADLMVGGNGDDRYEVDDDGDQLVEAQSEGWDTVFSTRSFTLGANLESLILRQGSEAVTGTGNALDNWITGNSLDNQLTGLEGADALYAGAGNDTVDGGDGDDYVEGAEGDDVLVAGAGNDVLQGGWGADAMFGGLGDDRYFVDNAGDVAQDVDDGGNDHVQSTVTFTLGTGLETLQLDGAHLDGTGNALDNTLLGTWGDNRLQGLEGNDTLDGGWSGNDLLEGGSGNDTYRLRHYEAQVLETEGAGYDRVHAEISYTLADNVEALVVGNQTGEFQEWEAYLSGTGNGLDNEIRGSRTGNQLYGLAGNDSIDGWAGNDRIEGGEGADRLYGGDDHIASSYGGYFGYGQTQLLQNHDFIDGGAGDDWLDGGSGDDSLYGGAGNDELRGGADLSPIDLAGAVDPLSNNDLLDGGAGIDRMLGGTGDDTYIVDGEATLNPGGRAPGLDVCDGQTRFGMDRAGQYTWTSDTVVEQAGEGFDSVFASATVTAHNVERVFLMDDAPVADIGAFTGAGAQELYGNAGRNWLDGGAGADRMEGRAGDDTYVVDDHGDVVLERAGEGLDAVRTTLDGYALGEHLETLVLEGTADIGGAGNAADNVLIGNTGDNVLSGGGGSDTLGGWRGDDQLLGGEGEDTYLFSRGDGSDVVDDAQGRSVLHFSAGIRRSDLRFSAENGDLVIRVVPGAGTEGMQVTLRHWMDADVRADQVTFCSDEAMVLDESVLNSAPLIVADAATVLEDGPDAAGNVLANDSDPDAGDTLSVVDAGTRAGQYGSLQLLADGSFTYVLDHGLPQVQQLAHGQTLVETFTYTATDDAALPHTATGELTIRVVGTNDGPVALHDAAQIGEDAVNVSGGVLGNDTDVDAGDTLSLVTQGSMTGRYGSVSFAADGSYTYALDQGNAALQALAAHETATEVFEYVVTDQHGATSRANLVIDVLGANDGPVASNDQAAVLEDDATLATGNVLANDSDVDRGTVLAVAAPGSYTGQYGTLQLAGDGSYTYTLANASAAVQSLATGQQVHESFSYAASDGLETAQGVLHVQITGKNDAPELLTPAVDVEVDEEQAVSIDLPDGMFRDIDQGDVLGYSARLVGGAPLPSWLRFDADGLKFSGMPPHDSSGQSFDIELTAMDRAGATATDVFRIAVSGCHGLTLIGGNGRDVLVGGNCADTLDGRAGADEMRGGDGDDTYYVDTSCQPQQGKGNEGVGNGEDPPPPGHEWNWNDGPGTSPGNPGQGRGGAGGSAGGCEPQPCGDAVIELAGQGWDTVYSTVSYVLPQHLEALRLQGSASLNGAGNAQDNWLVGNSAANTLDGHAGNDLLAGGGGNDVLNGGAGLDVLEGQDGADTLNGGDGNDALFGGAGNDQLLAGNGKAFVAGGRGSDAITLGNGAAVVAFNRGDGADTLTAQGGQPLVLSLGGGIRLEDVALRRSGSNLVVEVGNNESLTLAKWYSGSGTRPQLKLQLVTAAAANYAPAGDSLHDNKLEWFDGQGLVAAFEQARQANPKMSRWAVMNAALDQHLGGSDSAALGGDLAFQQGMGTLAGMGMTAATAALADTGFGAQAQALHGAQELKTGMARLAG